MMRLLLVQCSPYLMSYDGASIENRRLCERLAAAGHECRVVVPAFTIRGRLRIDEVVKHVDAFQGLVLSITSKACTFVLNDVRVTVIFEASRKDEFYMAGYLAEVQKLIADCVPDWIVVASEDRGQRILETVAKTSAQRTIYIARSSTMLGVGPLCFFPNRHAADLLKSVRAILSVSEYLRQYLLSWAHVDSFVVALPTYGNPPFNKLARTANFRITMVNPCAVKGISIFLRLAQDFCDHEFAAVPGWGTTSEDLQRLRSLPNVSLLNPTEDLDALFRGTRVLLVPSLWDEAFGRVSIEAMARGIPVIASDVGGLREAKLGIDYLVRVNPIKQYTNVFDSRAIPIPCVPEQDAWHWHPSLNHLLENNTHYELISSASYDAANGYIHALKIESLLELFGSSLHTRTHFIT